MDKVKKGFSAAKALKDLKKRNKHYACVFPQVKFSGMEDHEKVVLLVRAHPIYLYLRLIGIFLFIILGFFFIAFIQPFIGGILGGMFVLKLTIVILTWGITLALLVWVKWYYNLFLISTNRILDLDFTSLKSVAWTTARLENIEDVEVKPTGLIHVLFGLGNLFIQTAGSEAKIEIYNIPYPVEVQDILLDFAEIRRNSHRR